MELLFAKRTFNIPAKSVQSHLSIKSPSTESRKVLQLSVSLQLHAREAAAVEVEHTVPALSVTVGTELRVAARVVVETIHPALAVTQDQFFDAWRLTGLGTAGPTLACLTTVVRYSQPAFLHALLLSEDPPVALWHGVADGDAVLERGDGELVGIDAVVDEASSCGAIAGHISEERLVRVSNHRILLHAIRPFHQLGSQCRNRQQQKSHD